MATDTQTNQEQGLSPRVRGNRIPMSSWFTMSRSIPASAGEPTCAVPAASMARVYPRECGGTFLLLRSMAAASGLSPRVRGNRRAGTEFEGRLRSIPASAGEPHKLSMTSGNNWVYPRECGGTHADQARSRTQEGLSPRVRGNRTGNIGQCASPGSIPASAGEPCGRSSAPCPMPVYPRECGGTCFDTGCAQACKGLSPRVRGNHPPCPHLSLCRRSIPASAGGTDIASCYRPTRQGLSPRVRGNRECLMGKHGDFRSIPASAGEPAPAGPTCPAMTVYPRECGGNPRQLSASSVALPRRVYPRECGGTSR